MKSRKIKAATKAKAFISKKKLKGNLSIGVSSDSGSEIDPNSFYQDEIDDFNKNDEKLSTDDELLHHDDDSSEQEEVFPITDDEKDWEEKIPSKSDAESDYDSEKDLPNLDAWGKKKSTYYSADFVDEDRGRSYREEDVEAAHAEEEGALAMQKSLAGNIAIQVDSKFDGLDESSDEEQEEVMRDWSAASEVEKIKFLKKTSPELWFFIDQFKEKLTEGKDRILPLLHLAQQGKIPSDQSEDFLMIKYQLLMHFCMNISFYMVLRSHSCFVSNHPVLSRIASYKSLLDQLKPINDKLKPQMDIILNKLKIGELKSEIHIPVKNDQKDKLDDKPLYNKEAEAANVKDKKAESKKIKKVQFETETKKDILNLYRKQQPNDKLEENLDEMNVDDQEEMNTDADRKEEKRTITYQIAKNKGLTPHRKKEHRNPRVKHRMKFKKAQIRRKGQVKEVTKELKRYDGEPSGISTHVIRSIKLK